MKSCAFSQSYLEQQIANIFEQIVDLKGTTSTYTQTFEKDYSISSLAHTSQWILGFSAPYTQFPIFVTCGVPN